MEKIMEIDNMFIETCNSCEFLQELIDEAETLGRKSRLKYELELLNVKKETLMTCLGILKRDWD